VGNVGRAVGCTATGADHAGFLADASAGRAAPLAGAGAATVRGRGVFIAPAGEAVGAARRRGASEPRVGSVARLFAADGAARAARVSFFGRSGGGRASRAMGTASLRRTSSCSRMGATRGDAERARDAEKDDQPGPRRPSAVKRWGAFARTCSSQWGGGAGCPGFGRGGAGRSGFGRGGPPVAVGSVSSLMRA